MINYLKTLLVIVTLFFIAACEQGLTERERECMELSGDAEHCIRSANRHYTPVHNSYAPVEHTNYYGHPDHGYWDNGQYRFNDPNSHYASSTNSFLLGAGLGGLATYAVSKQGSRSSWSTKNPNGWTEKKQYTDKNGKTISRKEFNKRKAQSARDKAKHQQKKKQIANQSNKKPSFNKTLPNGNKKPNTSGYKKPVNKPKVNKYKTAPKTKRPVRQPVKKKSYSRPSKPKRRY